MILKRFSKKQIWLVTALAISLCLVAIATTLLMSFINHAKTGKDLVASYKAYQLGFLGEVELGGCKIIMPRPWFPELASYKTMSIAAGEVPFVNRDIPPLDGFATTVSFLRSAQNMPAHTLLPPEKIGNVSLRFVKREFRLSEKTFALLSESKLYVASRDEVILRKALSETKIFCN